MDNLLSSKYLQLITDVTHIALGNAGASLAAMMKDEVLLKNIEIDPAGPVENFALVTECQSCYVLYTEIVGELGASTFLVVSPEAEETICQTLLPLSTLGQTEMREAVLLEIDNIVIASMVTKYSDILKKNIHGDVPVIKYLPRQDVEKWIGQQMGATENGYFFRGRITTFYKDLSIEFICFFRKEIIQALRDFDFARKKHSVAAKQDEPAKAKIGFFKRLFQV
jgi:chemotaxis protein CheY-P-specific phosphatase CheC